jgi:fatty acid desaturase
VKKDSIYSRYRGELLTNQRVREFSQLRPTRAIRDIALCWAQILAAWVIVALYPQWWVVALAIVVVGTRFYGLFLIGHDGLHRRLMNDIGSNDLLNDTLIMAPIGAITRINNINHLRHHLHLATDEDPDRHKHGCFNKSEVSELLGYLTGVTSFANAFINVFLRRKNTLPNASPAKSKSSYTPRDFALLIGWQVLLIGGLSLAIGWWAYPVLWLMPVYMFTYLGDNFRSFAEHSHPESDEKADEHRLITYLSNPIERLFFAPMNMNYHAVHHLWPSIPYYNLPAADKEIRVQPLARELEWRYSYLGYLWRYYRSLPLEECKVNFQSEAA